MAILADFFGNNKRKILLKSTPTPFAKTEHFIGKIAYVASCVAYNSKYCGNINFHMSSLRHDVMPLRTKFVNVLKSTHIWEKLPKEFLALLILTEWNVKFRSGGKKAKKLPTRVKTVTTCGISYTCTV